MKGVVCSVEVMRQMARGYVIVAPKSIESGPETIITANHEKKVEKADHKYTDEIK